MTARLCSLILLAALLAIPLSAKDKDKNKSSLPAYVLKATTVLVVIHPDAGEPVEQPTANLTARDNVEKALAQWGRFRLVLDGEEADLVIALRTGSDRMLQRTIKGSPIDNRPGIAQPTDGGIRVGGQQGRPPALSDPGMEPQNGPRTSTEIGPSNDTFEVYRGGVQYPLDAPPVWRYSAKDSLSTPKMAAVEEFRKAIAAAEKPTAPTKP